MDRRQFLAGSSAGSFVVALGWSGQCGAAPTAADGDLAARFHTPPPSARPHTWWHWMNGNVTADGITRDLEAMARVGVGGVQMFDVGTAIPRGPVANLGDEWARLVRHAADECGRLGLSFTLHNCPGWSSSGGPWITPELSMQQLVWSEVTVEGGRPLDVALPKPFVRLDHFRDALTVAFPALPGDRTAHRGQISRATLNGRAIDLRVLADGDVASAIAVTSEKGAAQIVCEFSDPYRARSLTMRASIGDDRGNFLAHSEIMIDASIDGQNFTPVDRVPVPNWRLRTQPPIVANFPETAARFFRVSFPSALDLGELAFSSDARIPDVGDKANWGRNANVGEAPDSANMDGVIDPETVVDISQYVAEDGRLRWDAPPGEWTVLRFGHTATGARNVAAPDDGSGLECDKFSTAAIDFHFGQYFGRVVSAMERLGQRALAGAIVDSYETGMQNWTADLPDAFQANRGYSIVPFMPTFTGRIVGDAEISDRFLWDFRRLCANLMEERYYGRFHELCARHKLVSYTEPYGNGPFDDMQAGAKVDRLMGEFWVRGGAAAYSVKVAATTAHVYGKRFIGAESFTGRPAHSRWLEHPYAMKALGDEMYCLGLNHFVFHRYAHQPHPTAKPGMTMGPWGFHFDRTNTWFEEAGPWLTYAARCQHMLQEGRFVADILYFSGENSPVQVPVAVEEPVAATLSGARPQLPHPVPPGYDYDVCDAEVLMSRVRMEDGLITLPDGIAYRILVMPNDTRITVQLLSRLRDLVAQGMWLVGERPKKSHGLKNFPDSDDMVTQLADQLWGDLDGRKRRSRKAGLGMVIWGMTLEEVMELANLAPDVEIRARSGNAMCNWIHRHIDGAEVYFIANGRRRPEELICTFRVAGRRPECWDPMTGAITPLPDYQQDGGRTRVALRLDEAGSCFVIFRAPTPVSARTIAAFSDPAPATARGDFAVSAWIKPETDLWPVSPDIASDDNRPEVAAARAAAVARGSVLDLLGRSGASFIVDPPAATGGAANLAISAGRNGVILYAHRADAYPALVAAAAPIAGWSFLTINSSRRGIELYLDGRSLATAAPPPVPLAVTLAAPERRPRHFEGDLAALALHPAPLSQSEITTMMAAGLPAPEGPAERQLGPGGLLTLDLQAARVLDGEWTIDFPPDLGAPPKLRIAELASLHRHPDFGVRHFSGTAGWNTAFDIAPGWIGGDKRVYLDLGRVEVMASVRVNGREMGKLWKPPYGLDITDAVHAGSNRLRVDVTNLWPNRLIGDEHLPADGEYGRPHGGAVGGIEALPSWYREGRPQPKGGRVAFTTWKHYDKQSPLLESGLLGPVRLIQGSLRRLA